MIKHLEEYPVSDTRELDEIVLTVLRNGQHKKFHFPITCFYELRDGFYQVIKKLPCEYKQTLVTNKG